MSDATRRGADGNGGDGNFGRREYDRETRPRSKFGRREYDHPDDEPDDERRTRAHEDDRRQTRADDPERAREPQRGDETHARSDDNRERGDETHARGDDKREPVAARAPQSPRQEHSFRTLGRVLTIALVVAALGTGLLFWRSHHRLAEERQRRQGIVNKGPRVFVSTVRLLPGERDLTLPADVRGFFQSTIYAKVAGYVKTISVDKGDSVRAGQIIGVIESPEVDQQVAAAEADLVIKKRTFERYGKLVGRDFVSAQDYDTTRAQYGVSEATLRQMRALQGYEVVRVPFAGVITARYVDPGALVPAATGSTQSATPLVDVADLRRLRITVFVQQDVAAFLRVGDPVSIAVEQQPNVKIAATITRFARSLDPRSRTMLAEIWVDNRYHLYPGTFVHVQLRIMAPPTPTVASSALLLLDAKPKVAVIRDNHVHFVVVQPGLDDGHTVQIKSGVNAGERVAVNLPAEIPEGAEVQAVDEPAKAGDKTAADAKPADAKSADAKPADAKPADAKPDVAKSNAAKPGDAKAGAAKSGSDGKTGP